MRLIDEKALIEEAQTGGWDIDIKELKMILQYVPTIDAVPVDARQLALKTRVCPMCEDCNDGCPVETPRDSSICIETDMAEMPKSCKEQKND